MCFECIKMKMLLRSFCSTAVSPCTHYCNICRGDVSVNVGVSGDSDVNVDCNGNAAKCEFSCCNWAQWGWVEEMEQNGKKTNSGNLFAALESLINKWCERMSFGFACQIMQISLAQGRPRQARAAQAQRASQVESSQGSCPTAAGCQIDWKQLFCVCVLN